MISNKIDGKSYVGKSNNVRVRLIDHRCSLKRSWRGKDVNRYLYAAVKKHGIDNFTFVLIEQLECSTEMQLSDRELFWIDHYKTCDRRFGYNLRRDSSTLTVTHPETCAIHATNNKGGGNPNYGNKWSDQMKADMSMKIKKAHADGRYGEAFRNKQKAVQSARWDAASQVDRLAHGCATSTGKQALYDFGQYDFDGNLLNQWSSVEAIIIGNSEYKWQNIYAACNGNKPSAYGFMWRRAPAGYVLSKIDPIIRKWSNCGKRKLKNE